MLREPLEELCRRLDGALAASVVGVDGVPVDAVRASDAVSEDQVEELWVEYASLLRQIRNSAQMLAAGQLEELLLSSDRLVTIIRPLTAETFLAFGMRADASCGRARYLCRVTAPRLLEELTR